MIKNRKKGIEEKRTRKRVLIQLKIAKLTHKMKMKRRRMRSS